MFLVRNSAENRDFFAVIPIAFLDRSAKMYDGFLVIKAYEQEGIKMLLLFFALSAGIIKVESVKTAGNFLTSILPLLFVPPVVSLLDCWSYIRSHIGGILLIFVLSSFLCFGIAGRITQHLIRRKEDK